MPSALRRLFATILVYFNGKDINTYPLPKIIDGYNNAGGAAREEYEERIIEPTAQDIALKDSLNEEQKAAYDKILATIDTDQGGVFFVDGPGGTGKTYLYKALLATLRSHGRIAVATATSGVAASIMPGGRTAHSRFKIPLAIDDGAVCSFTKQSGTTKLLQKAFLIIWDEASMTKRQAVEALDNNLRDIMDRPRLLFGGKTMVFGGDFRQFKRKKFPVRLSFAMTVNKAQGQTIPNVGVYLPEPVFSHGQLYVALSRATARSNIKILAIPAIDGDNNNKKKNKKKKTKGDEEKNSFTINDGIYTKNIVYKEVLTS
ncbi:hypothetical protein U9M48_042333 [Paspalum notatum var. saurae]|uniref:ATP-dependent DNA helicase n=1 Tax=Paspalum notatum var. saurae TaxID=547442 RepID=A0AAQ3XHH1_PASNO